MIVLDGSTDVPVYQQIAEQVRLAVAGGRLHPGDRLEPVRRLAQRLGVNASTVARAYRMLEQEGVIETNRRRGSVIARAGADLTRQAVRENRVRGILERALLEALALGYEPEEAEAAFGLALAAWRERRLGASTPPPSPAADVQSVSFAGSHDLALEALWAQARRSRPDLALSVRYVGSLEGLLALWRGEVDLAGAHLLDEESGEYNLPIVRRLFAGQSICLITLAERQQGLIVPPGNPLNLLGWRDLARPGLRFVNRQRGSGTRALLDFHLRSEGIAPKTIAGYDSEVQTHMGVAAAVAEGRADVGIGLLAAARAYGLGFVPLAGERYDLVLRAETRERGPVRGVLDLVTSDEFRAVVAQLGGYHTAISGRETTL